MPIAQSTTKSEDEDSVLPPPPDGGWGWIVVFGSFMIHIVTDGVTYSFGVFYDEFLTYFDEGKGATAWILSILVGMTLCAGPISSSFVNRWGCRVVTIAGAILASFCMIMSCFAKNVTTLYFTVGIGTGIGFGLIYLPAIVCVTMYFEKKRSLATGIAVCGSGFGTFIFAPIINLLLYEYGWRGAMLIVGGIILECILFGALFRPLEYGVAPSPKKSSADKSYIALSQTYAATAIHGSEENIDSIAVHGDKSIKMDRPHSMGHFSTRRSSKNLNLEKNGGFPVDNTKLPSVRLASSHPILSLSASHSETKKQPLDGHQYTKHSKPLSRPDIFYQGSLVNISYHRSRNSIKSEEQVDLLKDRSSSIRKFSRNSNVSEKPMKICGITPCTEDTKDTFKEMLDFSLFKDPIFLLYLLSNFFTSIGFNVPYVYIVSKAKGLGISAEKASMLLSVIGIANTVGRIVLGYISDNPKVNRLLIYNMCLTICGIATALSAFCLDFYTLAIYGSVFGFTIGAYVGLTSVILVDLLGLENLTNGFGLLLLFQGIASLIGPPIAGELYDLLQSYNPGFYVAGITIALSGVMLFSIPPVQRWKQDKKSKALAASAEIKAKPICTIRVCK